ncbi:hypothetical protein ABIB49_003628 [Arthrobacter sp. UYCu512]
MLLLGWVLLERFVHADVAIRTTFSAGAPPVTALLLVALAVALTVLMACALQALLCTLLVTRGYSEAPGLEGQHGLLSLSLVRSAPVGGTGPRAPGRPRRRPGSFLTAL